MFHLSRAVAGSSFFFSLAVTLGVGAASAHSAIHFGQLDDFENRTNMGWIEGPPSPNPPTVIDDGGPGGAGDGYLRNLSSGGFGAGGRMVMFNQDQWVGDFNAAGVNRVSGWFANFGSTPLNVRVALEGGFSRFATARAFVLPADGVWRRASFDLTGASMIRVSGTAALGAALANVTDFRLLSSGSPSYTGDLMSGTLAVDDLRALRPEGDANFDGLVNGADLRLVRANLRSESADTWQEGDFNFDGRVNARDVALLRKNLGMNSGSQSPAAALGAAVVPEPAAISLLAPLVLALSRRRPRRLAHFRIRTEPAPG